MTSSIGYFKAHNTGANDRFGHSVSVSEDGNTLAVGATDEDSNSRGVDMDGVNNDGRNTGAVYVFTRDVGWGQSAYLKASNTDKQDNFGSSMSLSANGNTLAVGAIGEGSNATGIDGAQGNNGEIGSFGAVYTFTRTATTWSPQAYIKASNTGESDRFGQSVALSADGGTLAVAAIGEDSNAIGVNADDQTNGNATDAGAVYLY